MLAVELYEFHSITKLQHAILVTATNTVVMISEKAFTGIFAHGDQTVDNIKMSRREIRRIGATWPLLTGWQKGGMLF